MELQIHIHRIQFHQIYIHESKENENRGATSKNTSASTKYSQRETSFHNVWLQLKLQASLQGYRAVDINEIVQKCKCLA